MQQLRVTHSGSPRARRSPCSRAGRGAGQPRPARAPPPRSRPAGAARRRARRRNRARRRGLRQVDHPGRRPQGRNEQHGHLRQPAQHQRNASNDELSARCRSSSATSTGRRSDAPRRGRRSARRAQLAADRPSALRDRAHRHPQQAATRGTPGVRRAPGGDRGRLDQRTERQRALKRMCRTRSWESCGGPWRRRRQSSAGALPMPASPLNQAAAADTTFPRGGSRPRARAQLTLATDQRPA